MDRKGELDSLIGEVEGRLAAVVDEAVEEIREARERGRARKARYHEARRELAATERSIGELREEREGLIRKVAEADLEDDFAAENGLRDRYRDLKPMLEDLGARADALREELAGLVVAPGDSPEVEALRVEQHLSGEVAGTAHLSRADLEEAKERLADVVDSATKPLIRAHDETRGQTEDLGQRIAWHPEVRYGKEAVR